MPPSNQSSRLALVTWTVVTSILAVTCAILAIYFYVDSTKSLDLANNLTKKFDTIITPQILNNQADEIQKLADAKTDASRGLNPSMKAFEVALAERNNLAKLINGKEDDAAAATAAKQAMDRAKTATSKPVGDSLTDTVTALITELDARKAEAANAGKDAKEAGDKLKQVIDATQDQIASMNKTIAQLTAEKDAAMQQTQATSTQQQASFESTAADLRKQLDSANDQVNQVNAKNGDLGAQIVKLQTELSVLREKLGENRVDPTKAVVQRIDGHILRLPPDSPSQCLIDLGSDDHVTAGLTFEVYDKITGVPPAGDPSNDNNLPVGKGSIQIVSIYKTYSLCEITHITPGEILKQGDLLVNLVYDKYQKYNLVVYGNFDLDQRGVATPHDADVIKQLITQWGGNVVDKINVDTDFVVLGKEPVVPDKPKDENDALLIDAYNRALQASQEYADIVAKARDYRLPVLNQNRFLLFTGYYDQAQK